MKFAIALAATVALVGMARAAPTQKEIENVVKEAINVLTHEAEKVASMRYEEAAQKGEQKINRKMTRSARHMMERNRLMTTAKRILEETHPDVNYMDVERQMTLAMKEELAHRFFRSGRAPAGHMPPPSVMVEFCEDKIAPEECNLDFTFRTSTGECNNVKNAEYGASSTPFERFAHQAYADGMSVPRGGRESFKDTCTKTGRSTKRSFPSPCKRSGSVLLPNARRVSTTIHDTKSIEDPRATLMVMQFGQFLDHDMTLGPEEEVPEVVCCEGLRGADQGNLNASCIPVVSPCGDKVFVERTLETGSNQTEREECAGIMPLTRTISWCQEKMDAMKEPREQMNVLTAFVDASNVYGSTEETAFRLRSNVSGLLLVDPHATGDLLPLLPNLENPNMPLEPTAGDVRAIENPGLAAMHTIWLREHNRIAKFAKKVMPHLTDEEIYQQTRRIVIAEMQNVVYGQYVIELIGPEAFAKNFLTEVSEVGSKYDETLNPSVLNEFATAAYRFGHSLIQDFVLMIKVVSRRKEFYKLRENFDNATLYEEDMDALLNGMFNQRAQQVDNNMAAAIRETLFGNVGLASDLIARNIQRGREHGLPGYNEYRELCGMERACSWDQPPPEMPADLWKRMSLVYDNPSDIDLFTAGISEKSLDKAHVGATFACIIGKQFQKEFLGDRFFYTHNPDEGAGRRDPAGNVYRTARNPNPFSRTQLRAIRQRNLGDIICDNSNLKMTLKNSFVFGSGWLNCGRGGSGTPHNRLNLRLFFD